MAAEAVVFELADGTRWRRHGDCSHCGACCTGCPLRDAVAARCAGYGGPTYRGYGCDTWPSDPVTVAQFPACTYTFERVE